MGARDILGGSDDIDSLRAERQNRVNPPEFAPGQEEDDSFFDDDLFGADDSVDMGSTTPSLGLGTDSTGMMGTFNTQPTQPMQPMQQQGSTEDKIFDAVVTGGKGLVSFIKEFTQSFKGLTPKFWAVWGSNTFVTSIVVAVVGIVLMLFKFTDLGRDFIVGGLISAGTGALVLMFNKDKAAGETSMSLSNEPPAMTPDNGFDTDNSSDDFGDSDDGFGFDDDDGFDFEDFSDSDGFDDFDDFSSNDSDGFDDDDDFFSDAEEVLSAEPQQGVSIEEAMETLVVPDKGMFTRQYLYDAFTRVLDNLKPDFATVKTIDEDSDVFIQWEKYLRDACEATGVKEENLPDLYKLEENLFTIKLTFSRPVGLKHDLVANELATLYAYAGGEFNSSVYAKSDVIGKNCVITVFTGETAMISIKDMYEQCKDFMLDNKNYMPVVIGINPQGKVIKFDFKKLESILITGMPRSGKSWFVQAVLTQMCAFVPPSELNIYICDPKEGISDFKAFQLPHVKKFVSGDANIVNTLRQVVRDLAPKRKKIIGDAGFVNIWDYKERNPDVHMPVIYILIDEVVTLAERMEKEVKQEFQGLLVELISQLPALGIRAFLIPHVVKNDIIAKTATDLIPCRISVCGDAGHIESTTGTKPKEFPYKLTNKGDMAVKLPAISPDTLFIHGPALSDSNPKNNDIFQYLLKLWSKLEPEEVKSSVASNFEVEEENQRVLANLDLDTDDVDVFANNATVPVKGVGTRGTSSSSTTSSTIKTNDTTNSYSGENQNIEDNSNSIDVFGDDDLGFNEPAPIQTSAQQVAEPAVQDTNSTAFSDDFFDDDDEFDVFDDF